MASARPASGSTTRRARLWVSLANPQPMPVIEVNSAWEYGESTPRMITTGTSPPTPSFRNIPP